MNVNDGQHPTRSVNADTAAETREAQGIEAVRLGLFARAGNGLLWLLGHAPKILPALVIGLVAALSWHALRAIHPREVRAAFHGLDSFWLLVAAGATVLNIGVMGLYDVIAFEHTRSRWFERWRYGAVSFAWSNFLTLGPLAGPAIRFWLYRPAVDKPADLEGGVVSIATAFTAGLGGWAVAAWLLPAVSDIRLELALVVVAFLTTLVGVHIARTLFNRIERLATPTGGAIDALHLAVVGWLDWLLAALAFSACLRATGVSLSVIESIRAFFFGQAIGLASLVPGGFGSADAFWIARLPIGTSVSTAALLAYRLIYYVIPWAMASLLLLSWATHRATKRLELARRLLGGIVGAAGLLILLSAASFSIHSRFTIVNAFLPLPVIEVSHLAAAATGILLLVLARGLARGYRAALHWTVNLLVMGVVFSILKGLDWEEAVVLALVAVLAVSQRPLFTRKSRGDWIESRDVGVAFLALTVFIVFGTFAYHVRAPKVSDIETFRSMQWAEVERNRFLRSATTLLLVVSAGAAYVLIRVPIRFKHLAREQIDRALDMHAEFGGDTSPQLVACGDKDVFEDPGRGFCLYRTIGPYLVVFSDPVVRSAGDRGAFLNALFDHAGDLDRRPVFYQMSLNWIPALHDRGYAFFKLGEEAHVSLETFTLEGHAGKEYRQFLRRAERDKVRFRVLPPYDVERALPELADISAAWLESKGVRERQFSVGFFDPDYIARFPCAVVEDASGRIIAFANLLLGPAREELSIDLMRYRDDAPRVMDFMFTSLFTYGKQRSYKRFNMGMAPLSSVGEIRGAHTRERLANLFFQHGETWYNFQGLRLYKEKFGPEWAPRYMAYQNAWEWPVAIAHVSALIAGGWGQVLRGKR
jgi:phosphatidylglycerol lysyltransferase